MTGFSDQIRHIQRFVRLPLVYNHWYVAGLSEEFGRWPKARTLLDRSIVFFRTEAGELTAFQNRCLHRSFPLSEGYLEGDHLVCGYHGIRYAPNGAVVRVPSQPKCPNRKLQKYPVKEQGPFAFIWMGEDDHPDMETAFPDLPFLASPSFRTVHGATELSCSYLLMMENLTDLTHLPISTEKHSASMTTSSISNSRAKGPLKASPANSSIPIRIARPGSCRRKFGRRSPARLSNALTRI